MTAKNGELKRGESEGVRRKSHERGMNKSSYSTTEGGKKARTIRDG